MNWKILAIILFTLLLAENLFLGWGMYLLYEEDKDTNECMYNICSEFPQALYEAGVCYCYEYDMFGELKLAKTKLMD